MRKLFVGFFVLSFLLSGQMSSSAANVTLRAGKAATVIFPDSVTLKKSGCQNISVKYAIGKMPEMRFGGLAIRDASGAPISVSVFYEGPDFITGKIVSKKSGSFNLKVCREDWSVKLESGGIGKRNGVSKGKYGIFLVVDAPATEVPSTITFK